MPLDNRVLNMTPGEALLDVPMADIIERMGRAIAQAQLALDQASIQTAVELGDARLTLHNSAGAEITRSLLELGFLPTFYQFVETTIDITVSLSIRVGETVHLGATATVSNTQTSGTGATGTSTSLLPGPTGPTGPAPVGNLPTGAAPIGTQILSAAQSQQTATMFGLTVTADYTRRYDFDTSASSKVSTKMLAVPAPPAFLQALRENFGIGGG